jgi:hypothetical protein
MRFGGWPKVPAHVPDVAAVKRATNKMTESYGEARPIRVLLVDDHQLLTGALSQMLSRESDIVVAGVAAASPRPRPWPESVWTSS